MGGQKYFWKRLELALRGQNRTNKRITGTRTVSSDVSVKIDTAPPSKLSPKPSKTVD